MTVFVMLRSAMIELEIAGHGSYLDVASRLNQSLKEQRISAKIEIRGDILIVRE